MLSLSSPASLKESNADDSVKMLQVVMAEMNELRYDFRRVTKRLDERGESFSSDRMVEYEKIQIEAAKFHELVKS